MEIDWNKIDTVLLDMDGTLLDLHFDNYFWRHHMPQAYAAKKGLSLEDTLRYLAPLFEKWSGKLEWYCVNHWSEYLDIDIMALKREVADRVAYRPKAQEFLKACNRETNDVRMITNGHRRVLDLKIERTSIDRYFDQLICSHELGFPKEEQGFWVALQKVAQFDPEKTLFIDDNDSVLESAQKYGIGYLYSIESPDSQRPREKPSQFTEITEFCV